MSGAAELVGAGIVEPTGNASGSQRDRRRTATTAADRAAVCRQLSCSSAPPTVLVWAGRSGLRGHHLTAARASNATRVEVLKRPRFSTEMTHVPTTQTVRGVDDRARRRRLVADREEAASLKPSERAGERVVGARRRAVACTDDDRGDEHDHDRHQHADYEDQLAHGYGPLVVGCRCRAPSSGNGTAS
jgi:hypothetical protein